MTTQVSSCDVNTRLLIMIVIQAAN